MNNEYNPQHGILKQYVNCAADLAESVEKDVKKGKKISNDTVLALSRFIAATNKFQKGLDVLNAINDELN